MVVANQAARYALVDLTTGVIVLQTDNSKLYEYLGGTISNPASWSEQADLYGNAVAGDVVSGKTCLSATGPITGSLTLATGNATIADVANGLTFSVDGTTVLTGTNTDNAVVPAFGARAWIEPAQAFVDAFTRDIGGGQGIMEYVSVANALFLNDLGATGMNYGSELAALVTLAHRASNGAVHFGGTNVLPTGTVDTLLSSINAQFTMSVSGMTITCDGTGMGVPTPNQRLLPGKATFQISAYPAHNDVSQVMGAGSYQKSILYDNTVEFSDHSVPTTLGIKPEQFTLTFPSLPAVVPGSTAFQITSYPSNLDEVRVQGRNAFDQQAIFDNSVAFAASAGVTVGIKPHQYTLTFPVPTGLNTKTFTVGGQVFTFNSSVNIAASANGTIGIQNATTATHCADAFELAAAGYIDGTAQAAGADVVVHVTNTALYPYSPAFVDTDSTGVTFGSEVVGPSLAQLNTYLDSTFGAISETSLAELPLSSTGTITLLDFEPGYSPLHDKTFDLGGFTFTFDSTVNIADSTGNTIGFQDAVTADDLATSFSNCLFASAHVPLTPAAAVANQVTPVVSDTAYYPYDPAFADTDSTGVTFGSHVVGPTLADINGYLATFDGLVDGEIIVDINSELPLVNNSTGNGALVAFAAGTQFDKSSSITSMKAYGASNITVMEYVNRIGPIQILSGAGTVAANGQWYYKGDFNNRPSYRKADDALSDLAWTGTLWVIVTAGATQYHSSDDVATPDLVTTWVNVGGSLPVPSVLFVVGSVSKESVTY